MNILKIVYVYEDEEKEAIFSNVQRFYEAYSYESKELITAILNPDILDEVYYEMLVGDIKKITLHTEATDDPDQVLDVIITDYEKIRDIRRECELDRASITTHIIFNKSFKE